MAEAADRVMRECCLSFLPPEETLFFSLHMKYLQAESSHSKSNNSTRESSPKTKYIPHPAIVPPSSDYPLATRGRQSSLHESLDHHLSPNPRILAFPFCKSLCCETLRLLAAAPRLSHTLKHSTYTSRRVCVSGERPINPLTQPHVIAHSPPPPSVPGSLSPARVSVCEWCDPSAGSRPQHHTI